MNESVEIKALKQAEKALEDLLLCTHPQMFDERQEAAARQRATDALNKVRQVIQLSK